MAAQRWIDISLPLRDGLVPWPGDPPFRLERVEDMARGDRCTFSTLSMSAHAGTHIDAPLHFLKNGQAVEALPIDATVGPARIVPIRHRHIIDTPELQSHRIRIGERVLLKTRNSSRGRAGRFLEDYVAISPDGARYLASRRLRSVGIDGPSVGPFNHGAETHRILLGAGIWIIEFLDLSHVPAGPCDLICLPLRIVGGDGAPARAIIMPRPARHVRER
jgi:arylformamidase